MIQTSLAVADDLAAIGQTTVLLLDLLIFTGLQGEGVELFDLVLQQLAAGLSLALVLLQAHSFVLQLSPLLIVLAGSFQQAVVAGIAIEDGELVVGFEQQLMGVLTVNIDEQLSQALELS